MLKAKKSHMNLLIFFFTINTFFFMTVLLHKEETCVKHNTLNTLLLVKINLNEIYLYSLKGCTNF